ncbi:MAG: hypothetical protein AAF982_00475 [Pseudomonadota bacterium]
MSDFETCWTGLRQGFREAPAQGADDLPYLAGGAEITENTGRTRAPSLGYGEGRIMVHEENIAGGEAVPRFRPGAPRPSVRSFEVCT